MSRRSFVLLVMLNVVVIAVEFSEAMLADFDVPLDINLGDSETLLDILRPSHLLGYAMLLIWYLGAAICVVLDVIALFFAFRMREGGAVAIAGVLGVFLAFVSFTVQGHDFEEIAWTAWIVGFGDTTMAEGGCHLAERGYTHCKTTCTPDNALCELRFTGKRTIPFNKTTCGTGLFRTEISSASEMLSETDIQRLFPVAKISEMQRVWVFQNYNISRYCVSGRGADRAIDHGRRGGIGLRGA